MSNEELDSKINNAFPVFLYCDRDRSKALGLDGAWKDQNDLAATKKKLSLLGLNITEFLNMEFPFKGVDWSRRISNLKMYPLWERLEWARKREQGYRQLIALTK
jgi:hypothetical protein